MKSNIVILDMIIDSFDKGKRNSIKEEKNGKIIS